MRDPRIGCAGWHYQDWVGPVYPTTLPASKWLERYASLFSTVEVDATFYDIPPAPVVAGWIERTSRVPGFTFSAKVPQRATHEALPKGDMAAVKKTVAAFLERVVDPLEQAGRLEALLVQLPPDFDVAGRAGGVHYADALVELLRNLEPEKRRVAVEFRHASWYEHVGERLTTEAVEALTGLRVANVQVDGLGSRFNRSRTADWSYFRLHGRRESIPASEKGLGHAKYNYLYSREELAALAPAIRVAAEEQERTVVIFNNHYRGQAARNAQDMAELLDLPTPTEKITLTKETRLDQFGE